jgi:hypothetical protein
MKKRWTALIALVSLVVGIAGASWFWMNFNAQFTNHGLVVRTEADIVTKVAVLEHIRAGRIADATNLLETLLDGDLIGAGALARDGAKFKANTHRAVGLEYQARVASGYKPADQNVRNAVQEAFRLLPAASNSAAAQPAAPRDTPQAARP